MGSVTRKRTLHRPSNPFHSVGLTSGPQFSFVCIFFFVVFIWRLNAMAYYSLHFVLTLWKTRVQDWNEHGNVRRNRADWRDVAVVGSCDHTMLSGSRNEVSHKIPLRFHDLINVFYLFHSNQQPIKGTQCGIFTLLQASLREALGFWFARTSINSS